MTTDNGAPATVRFTAALVQVPGGLGTFVFIPDHAVAAVQAQVGAVTRLAGSLHPVAAAPGWDLWSASAQTNALDRLSRLRACQTLE